MLELGQLPPRWGRATGIVGYCYNHNNEKGSCVWYGVLHPAKLTSPPLWRASRSSVQFLGSVSAVKDCPLSHCAASSAAPCLSLKSAGVRSSCPTWEIKTGLVHTAAKSHAQTHAQGRRDSLTYPLKFVSLLHFSPANFVVHSTHQEGTWPELSELHYPLSATNTKMMITHPKLLQMVTGCVCIYVPEQSPSPSVWVESHFCLSEQSSSEDSPASPGAPCTYITAQVTNRINRPSYCSSPPNTPIHSLLYSTVHFIKSSKV